MHYDPSANIRSILRGPHPVEYLSAELLLLLQVLGARCSVLARLRARAIIQAPSARALACLGFGVSAWLSPLMRQKSAARGLLVVAYRWLYE
jgi:hypothetical protein